MTGFDPGRPRLRGLLSAVNRARLGNAGQKAAGEDAAAAMNAGDERRKAKGLLSAVNRARLGNAGQRVTDRLRRLVTDRLLRLLAAKARGEIRETDFVGLRARSTCIFCASPT